MPTPIIKTLTTPPSGAWTGGVAGPRAVYYNGKTYFGYSRGDNVAIEIRSYDHATGILSAPTVMREILEVDEEPDIHNHPAIVVRESDKRIMAFYCAHNGSEMYLWISDEPEDISSGTEDILTELSTRMITYPTPIQLTGEAGSPIYLFYRDRTPTDNDHSWWYSKIDDDGVSTVWDAGTEFFDPASTTWGYLKTNPVGTDRIDFGVVTGNPDVDPNGDLLHFYMQGGAFFKSDGTAMGSPVFDETDLTIVDTALSTMWDVVQDADGNPRIAYATIDGSDETYRYARWDGSAWNTSIIAASEDTGVDLRRPGVCLDYRDPNIAYAIRYIDGEYELYRYVSDDEGDTWDETQLTDGSGFTQQFLPYSIVNHPADGMQMIWLYGTYTSFGVFSLGIKGFFGFEAEPTASGGPAELILEVCDRDYSILAATPNVEVASIDEELGSAESSCKVTVPITDHVVEFVPNPDDEDAEEGRFRLWENGVLKFAAMIDNTSRSISEDGASLTFGGIQRGGELAGKNFGRRDLLAWMYPDVVRELTRDNIGRAPFATVEASNEDTINTAVNAITGEPQQGVFWSVEFDGSRPSTFAEPEWLTVDLGSVQRVDAIRVITEWWKRKWYKWTLATSLDGDHFTNVPPGKANDLPHGERGYLTETNGLLARYVKITFTESQDGYPRLAQLMVLQNVAEVGTHTTYAVPWIENDDSGNCVTSGSTNRIVQDGAFSGDGSGNSFVTRLNDPDGAITHTFRGTSTAVYFTQRVAAEANIYLDGVLVESGLEIPANSWQYKGYEVTDLPLATHTLKVEQSSGTPHVDYFSGEYVSSFRRLEERTPGMAYGGHWVHVSRAQYSNQGTMLTDTIGAELIWRFIGDSLTVLGAKASDRGEYRFYIDSVNLDEVDAYSASTLYQEELFTWTGAYGTHELRIENLNSANPSSTGNRMEIDAIEGNFAHTIYLRSAHDSNLALLGRLSEMTNSFMRLNADGTIDMLGAIGTETGEIVREAENEAEEAIEEANVEGDYRDTASAILMLGKGTDNNTLRAFVQDKTAVERIGIKVAKVENRDVFDAYLLAREAFATLQDSKKPKRNYQATSKVLGRLNVGDTARLYAPRLGLTTGDAYRLYTKNTTWDADGKTTSGQFANKRDSLSKLLTRATRDLSVTTNTPQGFKNVTQYGGNSDNFVAETGGSTFRSAQLDFYVDDQAVILETKLRMKIGKYRTYERDTTSGGGSTSGASSSSTSDSGGSSTPTTGSEAAHRHRMWTADPLGPVGLGQADVKARSDSAGSSDIRFGLADGSNGDAYTYDANGSHSHSVTISSHTHGMAHTHSTPNHSHTQDYDIFEESSFPGAVSVLLDSVNIDDQIEGPFTATSSNNTFDVDLTGVLQVPGWHTLRFEAASGKGRITPYVIVKSLQLQ